jgi:uncharacterized membrane protein
MSIDKNCVKFSPSNFFHQCSCFSLLGLIILCIAWELWLAPLRPGGSWLVLKTLPLLFPLAGIIKRDVYTFQWSAMLILLYLAEGSVRATTESGLSGTLGWIECGLAAVFFFSSIFYVRPYKRAAKQLAKQVLDKLSK